MSEPDPATEETLQSLVSEMNGVGGTAEDAAPTARTEAVVAETADALYDDPTLALDDGLVKQSLPELLMALVVLRTGGTHGKGVIDDIEEFFGADLSPGTVYPVLHDLKEEGRLSVHELVQTKEYSVDDDDSAADMLRRATRQHLALGLIFQWGLETVSDDDEDRTLGR